MPPTVQYQTRTLIPGEGRVFVFDFSNIPEILAGATILSAVVTGVGNTPLQGLTKGTEHVLTADAIVDANENVVPAGKGVSCALFAPSMAGVDVIVECHATLNNGVTPVVAGKVAVRTVV